MLRYKINDYFMELQLFAITFLGVYADLLTHSYFLFHSAHVVQNFIFNFMINNNTSLLELERFCKNTIKDLKYVLSLHRLSLILKNSTCFVNTRLYQRPCRSLSTIDQRQQKLNRLQWEKYKHFIICYRLYLFTQKV